MTTCATPQNVEPAETLDNLLLAIPDTNFHDFLLEVDELVNFAPEILDLIEKDLDGYGAAKKKMRLADKRFYEQLTGDLPDMNWTEYVVAAQDPELETGRPRMPGNVVYLFLMIRGYLGSLTSSKAVTFLRESMSLYGWLMNKGLAMPAPITMLENVNAVSNATRHFILDSQIRWIVQEDLDDFKKLTADSTSVKGNSSWPTDARILTGLISRAHRLGQKLDLFDLPKLKEGWVPSWLDQMHSKTFTINLVAGKANSKGKLKEHYRNLLRTGAKALAHVGKELARFEQQHAPYGAVCPSRRVVLDRVLEQMKEDLSDAYRVIAYASDRVFRGQTLKSSEKILSLSDGSASFIKKGGRDPVIGYKPQLARSGNGFVVSLIVPEGNAADSVELIPLTLDAVSRTGVIPDEVSVDDGYASKEGRDELRQMGINVVSISGAKGRKLIGEADWGSEEYKDARDARSAVESLMFTIKFAFAFGRLSRRGQEEVTAELLEKVVAYNGCRITQVRNRKSDPKYQQAA